MELQKKIANTKNMDYDTAEAIKELLEQGPNHEWLNGLHICLNSISNSRKKEHTSRLIIVETRLMPTRNRQQRCHCIAGTFVHQSY
jgi:hypothetical protein